MEGFRQMMSGGNCAPGELQQGMAPNPMQGLMNQMVIGNTQAGVHRGNFHQTDGNSQSLNAVMKSMDAAWSESQQLQQQEMIRQQMMMQAAWQESQAHEAEMIHKQMAMQQQWENEMVNVKADNWKDDFIENEVLNAREAQLNKVTEI